MTQNNVTKLYDVQEKYQEHMDINLVGINDINNLNEAFNNARNIENSHEINRREYTQKVMKSSGIIAKTNGGTVGMQSERLKTVSRRKRYINPASKKLTDEVTESLSINQDLGENENKNQTIIRSNKINNNTVTSIPNTIKKIKTTRKKGYRQKNKTFDNDYEACANYNNFKVFAKKNESDVINLKKELKKVIDNARDCFTDNPGFLMRDNDRLSHSELALVYGVSKYNDEFDSQENELHCNPNKITESTNRKILDISLLKMTQYAEIKFEVTNRNEEEPAKIKATILFMEQN
ncbi:hypothetical protein COBT_002716 [Conglomerata obtusa]